MTLKEIAREAGVSISTVSRVVNKNSPNAASKEVQDKIWEIVRKTGYVPNGAARELKKGGSKSSDEFSRAIACLFARSAETVSDQFFSSLSRSIEQEAFLHNYLVKYTLTAVDIHNPSTYRLISDNQVEGIAVLGRANKELLKFLKEHFHYVAYTGLNTLNAKYDQIICDGYQAGVAAVNHLIGLGHTRIAYIGETEAEDRYTGYCAALSSHRLPLKREYIVNVKVSSEGGCKGAGRLLDAKADITAMFCANDTTAIGAMRAIRERGFKIPQDVSVISIDDIDTAQYLSPMLTTVHIPVDEMGKMTAKLLIDRIEGGHRLPLKLSLPFYIASRESCGPCRG